MEGGADRGASCSRVGQARDESEGLSESEEDADLETPAGATERVPTGGHQGEDSLPFIHDGQLTIFDLPGEDD